VTGALGSATRGGGRWPSAVVVFAIGWLVLAWSAILLVDVLGAQPSMPVWVRVFRKRGPTEFVQWSLLLMAVLVCLRGARLGDERIHGFLTLMAVATTVMLAEDLANISHLFGYLLGPSALGFRIGRTIIYLGIASVPTYALVRHWSDLTVGRGYLLAGYGFYAISAGASVPANLLGLYERIGPWMMETVFRGRLRSFPPGTVIFPEYDVPDQTGIVFLDFAIEESLELLRAACLLAGLMTVASAIPTKEPS